MLCSTLRRWIMQGARACLHWQCTVSWDVNIQHTSLPHNNWPPCNKSSMVCCRTPATHSSHLCVQVLVSPLVFQRIVLAGATRIDLRHWVDPVVLGQCMALPTLHLHCCVLWEVRAALAPDSDFPWVGPAWVCFVSTPSSLALQNSLSGPCSMSPPGCLQHVT